MGFPLFPREARLLALLLAACSPVSDGGQAASSSSSSDELRSLGYTGFVERDSGDRRVGVVHSEPEHVAPGYNLTSVSKLCTADLFDGSGRPVHRWQDADGRAWDHVELLPDGDLLVVGSDRGARKWAGALCEDHYLERLDFASRSKWKLPLRAHHDVQVTWSGDFMTLTATQRELPALDLEHEVIDNNLAVVSADGRVLEERSLYDACSKPQSRFTFRKVEPNPNKKFPIVDAFHCNSIDFVREPALIGSHTLYAAHNVLLSSRHQDSIFVLDWDRMVVLWQWGQGELSGPHDARFLPNGNVLVFDNGIDRRWTRVLELDPRTERVVWSYQDPRDRTRFFSLSQGGSQRLANGDTLIADSNSGRAFEVTREGRTVWEYLVPHFDEQGRRAEVYRIRRYPPEFVEGLLLARGVALPLEDRVGGR